MTRTWKHPRWPSADVWIKKIYAMEYYSAVKKDALESVLVGWMNLESVMQREVRSEENYHRWAGSSYGAGHHHGLCPQDAMYGDMHMRKFTFHQLFLMPCFCLHMVRPLKIVLCSLYILSW